MSIAAYTSIAVANGQRCKDLFVTEYSEALREYQKFGSGLRSMKALGNLRMAYRDEIPDNWTGKTYAFSPGLSKSSLYYEPLVADLLEAGIRVVRFDAFNTGGTLKENGGPLKGLSLEADGIAQAKILTRLNLVPGSVYIIGHSRGAATALITANILGPEFIARIDMVNPYVRWLPQVYKEQASAALFSNTRNMNLLNPWSYHPLTAHFVEMGDRYWSNFWANFGVEALMGAVNFESIVRKEIKNRPVSEATHSDFETEVAGVMAQFNAMKDSSILNVASEAHQKGIRAGLWTANQDRLVPQSVVHELGGTLNLNPRSTDFKTVDGGHNSPIAQTQKFLKWLLRN